MKTVTGRRISIWPAARTQDARRPRSRQSKLGASDTVCARRAGYVLHGYPATDETDSRKAILGTWLHAGVLHAARAEYGWLTERRVEDPQLRGHIDAVQLDKATAARLPKRLRPALAAEETTVEDVKTKSTYQWDSVLRYGATEAEMRQVILYADLLSRNGFADVEGQRQLARLGPVPVRRIRFRFINRDNGEERIEELAFTAERARAARWWVAKVRSASGPEELPRAFDGPGLSRICDNCPFRQACWGGAEVGRRPQSVLVHSDSDRAVALEEYVQAAREESAAKARRRKLRAVLDGSAPGVYGSNRLSWSGGNPVQVPDVRAMVALFRRAGVDVPMIPDAEAMAEALAAEDIPVPVRPDPTRRTPVSINVTSAS